MLVVLVKDWPVIVSGGILIGAITISALYPFFFAHYIAAYTCVICFLIVRGLAILHQWHFRRIRVGSVAVLFLISGASVTSLRIVPFHNRAGETPRAQISKQLLHLAGQHVVFVRYGANHSFHREWVYNAANVDGSRIVWCRAIDPIDDTEVTRYYKDRHIWIADVDRDTVRLSPYQPRPERK